MADDQPADPDVTEDRLLDGAVRLLQPARGHRAGTDAVLLAAHAGAADGERVVDLGSGSGAVGLMVAARCPGARLTFVEREEPLLALCRRNIELNGIADRAVAVQADVFRLREGPLSPGDADLILTNPPFFGAEAGQSSPDPGRRRSHEMSGGTLADWTLAAATLLRRRGRLCVIHRADALAELLAAVVPRLGGVQVTFVHPRSDRPASRVLLTAVRDGRSPLRVLPALVLHEAGGRFTSAAESVHRGTGGRRAPDGARPLPAQ